MSYLTSMLRTIGETLDELAGIRAQYMRGDQVKTITCVPVRLKPEFLEDAGAIRQEFQDFYLFQEQLGDWFPQPDDRIQTATETWQIVGGKNRTVGAPGVEVLDSTGTRIKVRTVRIKK